MPKPEIHPQYDFYGASWTEVGEASYRALCAQLEAEIKPSNALEKIYVAELAQSLCEIEEIRRWHRLLIEDGRHQARHKLDQEIHAQQLFPDEYDPDIASTDPTLVEVLKTPRAPTLQSFEGQTIRASLANLQIVDQLLRSAQRRRDNAIAQLDRMRGQYDRMRKSDLRLIDGDARDITKESNPHEQRAQTRGKSR